MTKYLLTGVGILLLCLLLCMAVISVLNSYTAYALSLLEQAQDAARQGEFSVAEDCVSGTLAFWEDHRGFFGVVVRHAEADQINTTFHALREAARMESAEEFLPACADLMEQIRHLSDMEQPRYANILTITTPRMQSIRGVGARRGAGGLISPRGSC